MVVGWLDMRGSRNVMSGGTENDGSEKKENENNEMRGVRGGGRGGVAVAAHTSGLQ